MHTYEMEHTLFKILTICVTRQMCNIQELNEIQKQLYIEHVVLNLFGNDKDDVEMKILDAMLYIHMTQEIDRTSNT